MDELSYIWNAVNNFNNINNNNINVNSPPPRNPSLHRSLRINEEQDMYNEIIDQPNGTVILYSERLNHRYYFCKINDSVYHIITNQEMSQIYCIRVIEYINMFNSNRNMSTVEGA